MTHFLLVLTFCKQLLTFFQEESQVIRDERKDHHAVDESLEQQIRESDDYIWIVRKNWSPRPSAIGSYGRQAGRQTDEIILALEIFKIL